MKTIHDKYNTKKRGGKLPKWNSSPPMLCCWSHSSARLIFNYRMFQGKSLWFNSNSHGKHTTHFSPNSILFRMLRAPHYWRSQFCELFRWIYICWPWTELFSREKSVSGAVCVYAYNRRTEFYWFFSQKFDIYRKEPWVYVDVDVDYRVVLLLSSIGRALLSATWWLIASLRECEWHCILPGKS